MIHCVEEDAVQGCNTVWKRKMYRESESLAWPRKSSENVISLVCDGRSTVDLFTVVTARALGCALKKGDLHHKSCTEASR